MLYAGPSPSACSFIARRGCVVRVRPDAISITREYGVISGKGDYHPQVDSGCVDGLRAAVGGCIAANEKRI